MPQNYRSHEFHEKKLPLKRYSYKSKFTIYQDLQNLPTPIPFITVAWCFACTTEFFSVTFVRRKENITAGKLRVTPPGWLAAGRGNGCPSHRPETQFHLCSLCLRSHFRAVLALKTSRSCYGYT